MKIGKYTIQEGFIVKGEERDACVRDENNMIVATFYRHDDAVDWAQWQSLGIINTRLYKARRALKEAERAMQAALDVGDLTSYASLIPQINTVNAAIEAKYGPGL